MIKMDKYLWAISCFGMIFAFGVALLDGRSDFMFGVVAHLLVLIPLVICVKNEKLTWGKKRKVYAALANALFFSTLLLVLMEMIGLRSDIIVILAFFLLFAILLFTEIETKFISGFLYAYLAILLYQFIGIDGNISDRFYESVRLETFRLNVLVFGWLMLLVGFLVARPPVLSFTLPKRKQRNGRRQKEEKQTKPRKNFKDLSKPIFRKPLNTMKKKLRNYSNKA